MTTAQDNKTNAQFLNDWKTGKAVSTHKLGRNEALGQHCVATMLDELIAGGYKAATWNAVPDAEWVTFQATVKAKIALTKDLSALTADDIAAAFNIAANYLEHGHAVIMNGTPVEDRLTMVKS